MTPKGKVSVPAHTKPGTYETKAKMAAKATGAYKGGSVTATAKVRVK